MCHVCGERHYEWCYHKCVVCTCSYSFSCAEVENICRRWNSVMAYDKFHQTFLFPILSMFTDSLVATDISGYVTVTYQLWHSQQWWANHIVFELISIERLNNIAPKWSNSISRVSHLVFALSQWSAREGYQISCIRGNVHCFEEGDA